MPGEFELIQQFFHREQAESAAPGVLLGIGDDCALLQVPAGEQLAVTVDTLVAGVHFPAEAAPALIAERALRTNLSDLAAMGASPLWFTLALTLPSADEHWLRAFSQGLFACARTYGIALVGGDTTAGPLTISIQAMGTVAPGRALRRDGANIGDFVLVTHSLGDGAAALAHLTGRASFSAEHAAYLHERFYRPEPRLQAAQAIAPYASAALDISDGLVADLQHICSASDLAAELYVESLPLSPAVATFAAQSPEAQQQAYRWALTGGDDYELCFTLPPDAMPDIAMLIASGQLQASVVGQLVAGSGVTCLLDGHAYALDATGYQHFSPTTT